MTERRRRPTLRDIADETGLSTAAVSYALRGLQVTPTTQRRVREVADRIGYQVDPIARALASGRTGYVGVLCDRWTTCGSRACRPRSDAGCSTPTAARSSSTRPTIRPVRPAWLRAWSTSGWTP